MSPISYYLGSGPSTVAAQHDEAPVLGRLNDRSKTKIVCTLGPATRTVEAIAGLIRSGATVFRLNFSHGTHQDHTEVLASLREAAKEQQATVAVLQDLCGPKIRLSHVLGEGGRQLTTGQTIRLTVGSNWSHSGGMDLPIDLATSYEPILTDVQIGEPILINDGRVRLEVVEKHPDFLVTEVRQGGEVSVGKGINLPAARLTTPSVTEKDWKDLAWGIENQVDYVALSFVRTAQDLIQVRDHLDRNQSVAQLIAKIERPEALINKDEILEWCDGIMVARGDLALETNYTEVPVVQKNLIQECRRRSKPVIVATQILDSMVDASVPTRAEVSDIANAVFDGTDAVMLSNESAVGNFPCQAVTVLSEVSRAAEHSCGDRPSVGSGGLGGSRMNALTQSVSVLAERSGATAVVVYTQSGYSARNISAQRLGIPVIAVTNVASTHRQLAMSFGITPVLLSEFLNRDRFVAYVQQMGLTAQWWQSGESIVFLSSTDGCSGDINTIQVVQVD